MLPNFLGTLSVNLFDWLHPTTCWACHVLVKRNNYFCPECLKKLITTTFSQCQRCGALDPFGKIKAAKCMGCKNKQFSYDELLYLNEYSGLLRKLILKGKGKSGEVIMDILGVILAKDKVQELAITGSEIVTTIPSPWLRNLQRGHNPAASLARSFSKTLKLDFIPGILFKGRTTTKQTRLSRNQRLESSRGVFREKIPKLFSGKRIFVVDDVITTGATMEAAAKALKMGGAREVIGIVLARTK